MDATTTLTLRCTGCGVLQEAKCSCGVPYSYISPGELAAKAAKDNPKMSSRKIAAKLGIDESTVREARKSGAGNPAPRVEGLDGKSYPAKRKRGRPRKEPGVTQAQRSIDADPQVWEQTKARAAREGVSTAQLVGQMLDPEVDPRTLSMTAQQKFDAAIRQATRKIDRTFELKVQTEVKARMAIANASTTEQRNKAFQTEQQYRKFMEQQKKLGTMSDWNNLMLCLHPDTRRSASDEKYDAAFRWVQTKKFAITGEK